MASSGGVGAIFADAYAMHAGALELLAAGDVRDAADKAWCATLRSTDALILAWTGSEPQTSSATSRVLKRLAARDGRVRRLRSRYFENQRSLHGRCFYRSVCEPIADTERLIRATIGYVREAERLAFAAAPPL